MLILLWSHQILLQPGASRQETEFGIATLKSILNSISNIVVKEVQKVNIDAKFKALFISKHLIPLRTANVRECEWYICVHQKFKICKKKTCKFQFVRWWFVMNRTMPMVKSYLSTQDRPQPPVASLEAAL